MRSQAIDYKGFYQKQRKTSRPPGADSRNAAARHVRESSHARNEKRRMSFDMRRSQGIAVLRSPGLAT
jgi:NAD-dependent DNA ligase